MIGTTASPKAPNPLEVEGDFGVALTLASLPGTHIRTMHTLRGGIPDDDAPPQAWSRMVGVPLNNDEDMSFLVFADPKFQQVGRGPWPSCSSLQPLPLFGASLLAGSLLAAAEFLQFVWGHVHQLLMFCRDSCVTGFHMGATTIHALQLFMYCSCAHRC